MVHRPRVFICYARADLQSALEIYDVLRRGGCDPWMDVRHLVVGQDWELEIRNAIEQADFFVACLSRNSVSKKGYVQKELKIALSVLDQMPEGAIYIIPVRLEECPVPRSLSSRQWLDWFSPDAPERLLAAAGISLPRPTDEEEQRAIRAKRPPTPLPGVPYMEIYTFGDSRVVIDGEPMTQRNLGGELPKELFFFLFQSGPRRREQIGAVLWPEASYQSMTRSFNNTLYRLRKAVFPQCVVYDRENDQYVLNWAIAIWSDVHEFEWLLTEARKWPEGSKERRRLLRRAVGLYRGDYLEDIYSDWCRADREELRQKYVDALVGLANSYLEERSFEEAIRFYRKALSKEPFREDIIRRLMRCYLLAGELALAIRQYISFREFLEAELGIWPTEETTALFREIAGEPPSSAAG